MSGAAPTTRETLVRKGAANYPNYHLLHVAAQPPLRRHQTDAALFSHSQLSIFLSCVLKNYSERYLLGEYDIYLAIKVMNHVVLYY